MLTLVVTIVPDILQVVNAQDIQLSDGFSAEKNEFSFSSEEATEGDVLFDLKPALKLSIAYPLQHNILPNTHLNWPIIGKNAPPPKV